jgi:MFS family permease
MIPYYYKVWATLLFGWMSLYMVRVGLSPVLVPLMKEFGLSYGEAGLLSSAIFWAYTFMQIPSGYMGDRWGYKRFLLLGTLAWSFLCFMTALVPSFILLLLVRGLTGLAEGTYFGNDRPIISAFTPPEKMARGQGISAMGMGLGMGLGVLLGGQIAEWQGWRSVFVVYSIPSLMVFFLIWKFVRNPEGRTGAKDESHFSAAFKSVNLWMLYLSGFSVMYIFWVLGTWAPAIFLELGVSGVGSSGVYAGVLGLIGVPALIASGIVSDKMKKRGRERYSHLMYCLIFMCCVTLLMGLAIDLNAGSSWFLFLLIIGGIGVWSFFPPFYAILADQVPKKILGTTFGAANTVGFMASLLAPWGTGYLRDHTRSFSWGFYTSAIILILGIFCSFLARKVFLKGNPMQGVYKQVS